MFKLNPDKPEKWPPAQRHKAKPMKLS